MNSGINNNVKLTSSNVKPESKRRQAKVAVTDRLTSARIRGIAQHLPLESFIRADGRLEAFDPFRRRLDERGNDTDPCQQERQTEANLPKRDPLLISHQRAAPPVRMSPS